MNAQHNHIADVSPTGGSINADHLDRMKGALERAGYGVEVTGGTLNVWVYQQRAETNTWPPRYR